MCRAVDRSGITFDGFLSRNRPIKGLPPSEITREVIAQAKAIERKWDIHAKNRVLEMGGSWNGEKKQVRVYPEDQIVLGWIKQRRSPTSRTELVLNLDLSKSQVEASLQRLVPKGSVKKNEEGKYIAG